MLNTLSILSFAQGGLTDRPLDEDAYYARFATDAATAARDGDTTRMRLARLFQWIGRLQAGRVEGH